MTKYPRSNDLVVAPNVQAPSPTIKDFGLSPSFLKIPDPELCKIAKDWCHRLVPATRDELGKFGEYFFHKSMRKLGIPIRRPRKGDEFPNADWVFAHKGFPPHSFENKNWANGYNKNDKMISDCWNRNFGIGEWASLPPDEQKKMFNRFTWVLSVFDIPEGVLGFGRTLTFGTQIRSAEEAERRAQDPVWLQKLLDYLREFLPEKLVKKAQTKVDTARRRWRESDEAEESEEATISLCVAYAVGFDGSDAYDAMLCLLFHAGNLIVPFLVDDHTGEEAFFGLGEGFQG